MTKWADQIYFKSAIDESKVGGIGILYNDNSVPQSIYLGYGNTPWNNGLKIDNNITFNNQKIYHQGFKPTSSEIGAVNKSGDTMIGNLFFNAAQCNMPIGIFMNAANNMNRGLEYYDKNQNFMGGFGATANQDRIQKIYIGTTRTPWDGNKSLTVDGNGAYFDNQKIYHQGDKPTPDDIGAISKQTPRITEGSLNSVINSGFYAIQAATVTDIPIRKDGRMMVSAWDWGSWSSQMYFPDGGGIFHRMSLAQDGTSWTNWAQIYTTSFKPTPNDIGALRKSGDIIDGNMRINGQFDFNGDLKFVGGINPIRINVEPSWSGWARGMDFNDAQNNRQLATIGAYGEGNNAQCIYLGFEEPAYTGANGLKVTKEDCFYKLKKIYHEGNDQALMKKVNPPSSHNCNDFKELNAFFSWDTGAGQFLNTPLGTLANGSAQVFVVKNYAYSNTRISQEFIFMYPKHVTARYIRSFSGDSGENGGWGDWQKVYTTLDKPTIDDIGALGKTQKAVDSDKLRGLLLSEPSTNYRGIAFVANDGVMEVGKFIDFHEPGKNNDYDVRLESRDGALNCWQDISASSLWAKKYLRINDWNGKGSDGRIYFYDDGHQMITENVEVFQSKKLKAKEGGITSEGPIYAWQHNITTDKDLIFGGKCLSTIQSGGANLYCEGRGGSTHGWHFADIEGSYADIYAKIYRQQSDARTKEEVQKNISLLKDNETTLEKMSKVNPKEFYYTDDTSKKILYGFFAQELESEFPIAVNTLKYSKEEIESGDIIFPKDKDGQDIHDLKSIDPVAISAIMWDALKEVYNSLEIQKIKNKELLDRIKVLEEKIK